MLLEGKVVLVTGGGRGIGACISRVVAQYGARVAINYSTSVEKSENLAAEIEKGGGHAATFRADVRNPAEVQAMVKQVTERLGRLDGVINNAIAGRQDGNLAVSSLQAYQNMFDFNCIAVLNTINAARPIMKRLGGGRIINIVSELWNMAPAGWSPYMAGKGAMVGVSRSLAVELGPENITVNMVAPGWMADEKVDTSSQSSIDYGNSLPLRRHGSADEIGKACVYLLSDLASYVTGAYIPVTGGRITQAGM
ncbi:MAG: SDR family oxidoreductase [Armatimonadetes bacterium]|nr:SDR family oxidoreductase [Armatimonadota bacterium]